VRAHPGGELETLGMTSEARLGRPARADADGKQPIAASHNENVLRESPPSAPLKRIAIGP